MKSACRERKKSRKEKKKKKESKSYKFKSSNAKSTNFDEKQEEKRRSNPETALIPRKTAQDRPEPQETEAIHKNGFPNREKSRNAIIEPQTARDPEQTTAQIDHEQKSSPTNTTN